MKRFAVAGGLVLAGIAGVLLADDKDLKDLQGKYTVTAAEKGGKVAEKPDIDGLTVTIKGDEMILAVKGEEKKAKIKVDASKTPHTIDISPTDGPEKGKTFPGVYKIEKGEVTLVFNEKGDRPKDVKAEGDATLVKMKKADK